MTKQVKRISKISTKELPWQLFDKHFLGYVKTLELRAKLVIGNYANNQTLIDKMTEIEASDKLQESNEAS